MVSRGVQIAQPYTIEVHAQNGVRAEVDEEDEEEIEGDHVWHFRYNRRLSCFSHGISALTFSQNGQWLISSTSSGDMHAWDATYWAQAGKLKGMCGEGPRSLVISPAQRWLVCAFGQVLQVYKFQPPWRLEQTFAALEDPGTKQSAEWCCVAFSPMVEVNHSHGQTGQDQYLAAISTTNLVLLDYSSGWGADASRRTRSLLHGAKPSSIAYTSDGWWLLCGFDNGQLQVWNAFSLTLDRTLCAHDGPVNCLTSSPACAHYKSRALSCGVDRTMRVWNACGWQCEQVVQDSRCDRFGLRNCMFAPSGEWAITVASELCIWRVCLTNRDRLKLSLHQRLLAVCGGEGLHSAAFSSRRDTIAVGSRDGVLGLWTKHLGEPQEGPLGHSSTLEVTKVRRSLATRTWMPERRVARTMNRITVDGLKPPPSTFASASRRRLSTAIDRAATLAADKLVTRQGGTPESSVADGDYSPPCSVERAASTPELSRWTRPRFEFQESSRQATTASEGKRPSSSPSGTVIRCDLSTVSPVRKSMQLASLRLVHRVTLEPHVIS